MRSGNHDSTRAFFFPNCKRQLRSRAIVVQEVDLKTVGDHDRRAKFCEMTRLVPSVVSDRAGKWRVGCWHLQDIFSQSLCAFANGSIVDCIGPDVVHSATPPACAERNDGPERIIQCLPFLGFDLLENFGQVRGVPVLRQPTDDVFQSPLAKLPLRLGFLNLLNG